MSIITTTQLMTTTIATRITTIKSKPIDEDVEYMLLGGSLFVIVVILFIYFEFTSISDYFGRRGRKKAALRDSNSSSGERRFQIGTQNQRLHYLESNSSRHYPPISASGQLSSKPALVAIPEYELPPSYEDVLRGLQNNGNTDVIIIVTQPPKEESMKTMTESTGCSGNRSTF